jgi:hypothetical protein
MKVDLGRYEGLVTYPPGRNWSVERKKVLFLQTAIRLGFEGDEVAEMTKPFFGLVLHQPPETVVFPYSVEPFRPPEYTVARQTPDEWLALADYEWRRNRDRIRTEIVEWRRQLIDEGRLVEIPRHRKHSGIDSRLKKARIVDEQEAFEWAVVYYFGPGDGSNAFADLARIFPARGVADTGRPIAQQTRQRAGQIRKRVTAILGELGLPMRK